MQEGNESQAKITAVKQLVVVYMMLSIQIAVYYFSAGHISLRPWIFFIVSFLHYSVSTLVQFKLNPELLVVRLKRRREGSKLWDEILMRASNLVALIAVPFVAGLDVGRYYWSNLSSSFVVVGFILLIVSTVVLNWAMAVNPYFEPTVRIQKDRGHQVITKGPYKVVRHPGYLAGILYIFSIPFIMGSVFTFIPVCIYTALIILRTLLEDRTLIKELNGYSEYVEKVRYRIFPWLW